MQPYVTQEGEVLDAICVEYYGASLGVIEIVLEQNPALAAYPAILPAGVSIQLPVLLLPAPVANSVSLWD